MNGEELTEQETALYDRQIRIWGADAQRRLSKSHILVSGITGTIVEFCKNVVLAGIGSLTLMDDRLVSDKDLLVNFLIPPDEDKYKEKTIAEVCSDSLRDFNPMVSVSFEKGESDLFCNYCTHIYMLMLLYHCYFLMPCLFSRVAYVAVKMVSLISLMLLNFEPHKYIHCYVLICMQKEMNIKCRKRQKKIAFYTVNCRDSCGEIFVDLQSCKYQKKTVDGTAECFMQYPSFEHEVYLNIVDAQTETKVCLVLQHIEPLLWRSLPNGVSL
ncbi:SUMO-activating enzyme subunit 1A [Nymphaea thermarum]|nr:SUMO-activating enzyme subunit 1A [Nymphaea thermarum]